VTERCPFCGLVSGVIWVRAHYQCVSCGQVIVPCCNGETAANSPVEIISGLDRSTWHDQMSDSDAENAGKDA
jgi:hypothetical protein